MFKVHINTESSEIPEDDICYIVAKEGIFLKKKLGIMESISPVKNISILKSISTSAKMHVEKIPAITIAKIVDFFKKVHEKYYSEAIVLLFYKEDTKKYRVVPPHQKVSGASVEYNRGLSLEGWKMIGTIHSHSSMSAFHSGVDDSDEKSFDGLHITIGNVNRKNFSITASIVSNGFRTKVEPEEYIDGIKKVSEINETQPYYSHKIYKYIDGKIQFDEESSNKFLQTNKLENNEYTCLAPPSKSECNPKWLDVVEKKTYTYTYNVNRSYLGYNTHFDPNAWREHQKFNQFGIPKNQLDLQKQNQILINKFSEEETEPEDIIPCLKCKYRENKILLEEEEYENPRYLCTKCDGIFDEDTLLTENPDGDIQCPTCKTDKYFSLLDETDVKNLESKFESISEEDYIYNKKITEEGFHVCKECGTSFLRYETDTECPYCHTSLLNLSEKPEKNIITKNRVVEKIPIPNSNCIPISEDPISALKSMFRKVFGKEK